MATVPQNPFFRGFARGRAQRLADERAQREQERLELERERLNDQRKEFDLRSKLAKFNVERLTRAMQEKAALERAPEVVEFPDQGEFQPEAAALGGIETRPSPIGGQLEPRELPAEGVPLNAISNPFGEGNLIEPGVEGRTIADVLRALGARKLAETRGTAAIARIRSAGADRRAGQMAAAKRKDQELAERRVSVTERRAAAPPKPSGGGTGTERLRRESEYRKAYAALRMKVRQSLGENLRRGNAASGPDVVAALLDKVGAQLAEAGVDVSRLSRELRQEFGAARTAPADRFSPRGR